MTQREDGRGKEKIRGKKSDSHKAIILFSEVSTATRSTSLLTIWVR